MDKAKANEQDFFWIADLDEIEAPALANENRISDLPVYLNKAIPHQGSVLLDRIYREPKPSFISKLFSSFF